MNQSDAEAFVLAPCQSKILEGGDIARDKVNRPRFSSVPISMLLPGESPRSHGVDQQHVARLADLDIRLPPLVVRRSDMRVIDGMHRLLAALIRGRETIEVEFFEGSVEDAFLRGVEANVAHGLPLSLADRRAAASRIIASHPQMSDRAVARISGLGAKAVASIRRRSTGAEQRLNARIGRDGRIRPLSYAEGRLRAAEVMDADPKASLREVARIAGISPATASDVRKRIQAGKPPTKSEPQSAETSKASAPPANGARPSAEELWTLSPSRDGGHRSRGGVARSPQLSSDLVLEKLLRDPSLRLKEEGRRLLRLLQQNELAEWPGLSAAVPPHCEPLVVGLARQHARNWLQFAQRLEERESVTPQQGVP
ncbi:ParB/RepB/Spo0J family partition protein [Streptomyces sp. TE33382]